MSALSTRRRFLGFSFPVHWTKWDRRSRRTKTSVPAAVTHNGGSDTVAGNRKSVYA